jgi:hypothetical protein
LQVFKDAGGKGRAVLRLEPFTPVTARRTHRRRGRRR